MWRYPILASVTLFFVTMNVLLWRSEFGAHRQPGSAIPSDVVWQKVLTAPDQSSLEIRHHGKRIGDARWVPSLAEAAPPPTDNPGELPPEGMVNQISSYNIDCDGSIALEELNRLRFTLHVSLNTNHSWLEFSLRLSLRPSAWEFHSVASEQSFSFKREDETGKMERTFRFSDLQNPEKFLQQFGGPLLPGALKAMGFPFNPASPSAPASLGLSWEARNDWLKIGPTRMRVHRLQARLLDRFQALFFVSPVGEILRIELPDDLVLVNNGLTGLY